ncbi:MAG: hypothetical protein WBP42_11565 [Candidatus Zixiibacteriota bacterium]
MGDADITRDQFDAAKRKTRLIAQRNTYIVDADFNDVGQVSDYQRAELAYLLAQGKKLRFGTGWNITGGSNQVTVSSGKALLDIGGISYVLDSAAAQNVSGWTTPSGNTRNDVLYLDISFSIFDQADDTEIINPAVGVEACVYEKLVYTLVKLEGTLGGGVPSIPTAPAGHYYVGIATIARASGVATIANIDISSQLTPWFPTNAIVFFAQGTEAAYGKVSAEAAAWSDSGAGMFDTAWAVPEGVATWYTKRRIQIYKDKRFNKVRLRCMARNENASHTTNFGITVGSFARQTLTITTQTWTFKEIIVDVSTAVEGADIAAIIELQSENSTNTPMITKVEVAGILE